MSVQPYMPLLFDRISVWAGHSQTTHSLHHQVWLRMSAAAVTLLTGLYGHECPHCCWKAHTLVSGVLAPGYGAFKPICQIQLYHVP
jgi:hypothetical protein